MGPIWPLIENSKHLHRYLGFLVNGVVGPSGRLDHGSGSNLGPYMPGRPWGWGLIWVLISGTYVVTNLLSGEMHWLRRLSCTELMGRRKWRIWWSRSVWKNMWNFVWINIEWWWHVDKWGTEKGDDVGSGWVLLWQHNWWFFFYILDPLVLEFRKKAL